MQNTKLHNDSGDYSAMDKDCIDRVVGYINALKGIAPTSLPDENSKSILRILQQNLIQHSTTKARRAIVFAHLKEHHAALLSLTSDDVIRLKQSDEDIKTLRDKIMAGKGREPLEKINRIISSLEQRTPSLDWIGGPALIVGGILSLYFGWSPLLKFLEGGHEPFALPAAAVMTLGGGFLLLAVIVVLLRLPFILLGLIARRHKKKLNETMEANKQATQNEIERHRKIIQAIARKAKATPKEIVAQNNSGYFAWDPQHNKWRLNSTSMEAQTRLDDIEKELGIS